MTLLVIALYKIVYCANFVKANLLLCDPSFKCTYLVIEKKTHFERPVLVKY